LPVPSPATAAGPPTAAATTLPAELGRTASATAPPGDVHTGALRVDDQRTPGGEQTPVIDPAEPCVVTCPPGGQAEGEPPCEDDYYDVYNGGCQQIGWTPIYAEAGGCGTICGRSCTFAYNGSTGYRDTDWYTTAALGGQVTATCTAEFPVQLILLRASCLNFEYVYTQGEPCETVSLTWDFAADEETWVWVGPSVFTGVPESDYVLEVCGVHDPGACCFPSGACHVGSPGNCEEWGGVFLGWGTHCEPNPCEATPVSPASWGRIKSAYR
jgi:hypothetical protein